MNDQPDAVMRIADARPRSLAWVGWRVAVFLAWFAAVGFMASRHVFWRDEGRALSMALQGSSFAEMIHLLHGEGHPAVWYVLLRAVDEVMGSSLTLPVVALAAVSVAAAMLLFLAPFPLWLSSLILASGPFSFEYSVMARNYGISAPLLFGMAALYPRYRDRGVWIGLLAAALANTNAHSVLLVGGFMLMWLADLAMEGRLGWTRSTGRWVVNGAVATVGIVACLLTLYPPANDAAVSQEFPSLRILLAAVLLPASTFDYVTVFGWANAIGLRSLPHYPSELFRALSPVVFGSLAGLIRWPAGVVAGLATLVGMSLFFRIVYAGGYRHQAIWLLMLIALYWILARRGGVRAGRGAVGLASRVGFGCFVILLVLQVPIGVGAMVEAVRRHPYSQVQNLALALRARPDLRDAIIIPDPDPELEAYPMYADNPIFLPRSQSFSVVSKLTNSGLVDLTLGDLLRDAQMVCRQQVKAVVLAIHQDLHAATLPHAFTHEAYDWSLTVSVADYAALLASTEFLGRFEPSPSQEDFDVYVLHPPCAVKWSG